MPQYAHRDGNGDGEPDGKANGRAFHRVAEVGRRQRLTGNRRGQRRRAVHAGETANQRARGRSRKRRDQGGPLSCTGRLRVNPSAVEPQDNVIGNADGVAVRKYQVHGMDAKHAVALDSRDRELGDRALHERVGRDRRPIASDHRRGSQ